MEEEEEDSFFSVGFSFISSIFYICVLSFFILFVGIMLTVIFQPMIDIQPFKTVASFIESYSSMVEGCFRMIFNGLHSLIYLIPNYDEYYQSVSFFSHDGLHLFHIFLFQAVIISLLKIMIVYFSKEED